MVRGAAPLGSREEGEIHWGGLGPRDPVSLGLGFAVVGGPTVLTCLPHEDLVWGAQGPLAHRVVHAHPDLVPPVLVQVCG